MNAYEGTASDPDRSPVPEGLSEQESVEKDTSYSPASKTETQQKQAERMPASVDDDIDMDDVRVRPGTGGPDDSGDTDVDPGELHMPGR